MTWRETALVPCVYLPDGREITLYAISFGNVRMLVGAAGAGAADQVY